MNDSSQNLPVARHDYERQLREINEALLVSSVRQHELIEQAQNAEAALRESEERLALELAATQRLQEISTQLIREKNVEALHEQFLDAAVAIMHSDMASMQIVDEGKKALRMLAWRGFDPAFGKIFELVGIDTKTTSCSLARWVGHRVVVPDVETWDLIASTPALEDHRKTGIRAVQSTPLFSRGGQLLGMISTHWRQPHQPSERDLRLLDVLARQAADLIERSQAAEALREAGRRKDEFLAMLGHELRNPLGIISTSIEILRTLAPSDGDIERMLDIVERQVIHTARMLDDLLDVSRISRGKVQLSKQRYDLGDLVRQTAEDYRQTLHDGGLQFELHVADQPLPIFGDRTRLSQAFGNLLQNACKFTEKGAVTVKLETDSLNAVLSVTDTGIGLEPEELGWVFEPFSQADRTLDRSRGGLGLGLALVKGIVQLHGGEVRAFSDGLARGSTFTIKLPLDHAEFLSEKTAVNSKSNTRKLRVLIIEDNLAAAKNMQQLLEITGYIVESAHSGPEGVEVARKFRPEIVLCDIGLPGMSGYDVAQVLRQGLGLRDAHLIAVSGYAQDEERSREVGYDAYITKPVNFRALQTMLASLAKDRTV